MESIPKCVLGQINVSHSALKNLRVQTNTCDICLVCDGVKFPAHRLILRVGSKYFETMFSSDLKEASSNEIVHPTIREELMAIILDFIYFQDVNLQALSDEQIWDLLSAAHLLELHPLVEVCVDELITKTSSENWTVVLRLAQKYSIERLIVGVVEHLAYDDLTEKSELLELEFDCFNAFVTNSSSRKCQSSDSLVKLIELWVAHDKIERKKHLLNLFAEIDFSSVSKSVIDKLITSDNDLFQDNSELSHFLLQKISHSAVTNTNNAKLLIFKSNNVHSFDLTTKKWSVHTLLETMMPQYSSPVAVSDRAVYYIADTAVKCSRQHNERSENEREAQMHIFAYYPDHNCGKEIASCSTRTKFAIVFLNDALYLVGGVSDNKYSPKCHLDRFDLNSNEWHGLTPSDVHREDPNVVALRDNLYVFGGKKNNSSEFHSSEIQYVEKYSCSIDQWTVISTLRGNFGGTIAAIAPCLEKIYLTAVNSKLRSDLFVFDSKDNSWKKICKDGLACLCRSSKPLPFLVFLNKNSFYRMDVRQKNMVFITNDENSGVPSRMQYRETKTEVIFS